MVSSTSSIMAAVNSTMITDHRYYPLEVGIASYLVNDLSVATLLSTFFGGMALFVLGTRFVVDKIHPNLPLSEKAAIWWFVLTGSIHLFFEGYFSVNHATMGPSQHYFGQLWKEYAFSDSRYLTSDAFVLCMETVTAFTWGPLCFFIAAYVTTSNPLRHPLQIIVCVGQMYGLILYYATHTFDHYYKELSYSRPEFQYYWFYYFFVNFIWMIIPGIFLFSSVRAIAKAFSTLNKMNVTIEAAGTVNGAAYTNNLRNGSAKKKL